MRGSLTLGKRVLVVDGGPEVAASARFLGSQGYRVEAAITAADALDAARRFLPDLVLVDAAVAPDGGLDLCHALRSDPRTAWASILLLSDRADVDTRVASFASGADDYVEKPVEPRELLARVAAHLERAAQLRGVSPLTGLPGNFAIHRELEALLAAGEPFAFVHADLDQFKAFNDRYGFVRGDEAIRITGRAIVDAVHGDGPPPHFVGHIGGDDFAVLVAPQRLAEVCARIVTTLTPLLRVLYDPEDRERGFVEVTDRRGNVHAAPLLTISMGVAVSTLRSFGSPAEVSSVASEMKAVAKSNEGSVWRVDRRRS